MNENIPEFNQKKSFLDLIFELPWGINSEDEFYIDNAKLILD